MNRNARLMRSSLRPSLRLASPLLVALLLAGCGKDDHSLEQVGKSLDAAGAKAGSELAKAGEAAKQQLADAGKTLDSFADEAGKALMQQGDVLAKTLESQKPKLEQLYAQVKQQAMAQGGALKDKLPELQKLMDGFEAKLGELAKAGSTAGADLKKATLDAMTKLTAALKDTLTKLTP